MKHVRPFLLTVILQCCSNFIYAQAWSGILDPSRAIDWRSGVGFTVPSYTTACSTQPSLATGSGNASANTTAINNAIASCDATHNVVNLPSGTYYIAGMDWAGKSNVVVRGAGPNNTYLYETTPAACYGSTTAETCMVGSGYYSGNAAVQPGGSHECSWTAGYSQGTTSITLNSCGGTPPVGAILVLDQANDTTDTGGIFVCDTYDSSTNCTVKGEISTNADGRVISGTDYSEQELTVIQSVSGSGSGPYTVTISPGVYFNNVRSGQSPGAWWASGNITLDGLEAVTLDHSTDTSTSKGSQISWCYQCWFKNVRYIDCLGNCVYMSYDVAPVVRDSYFYGAQSYGSGVYTVQFTETSGALVENNIMQQASCPIIADAISGSVWAYNFTPDLPSATYLSGIYMSHNAGSAFNLMEGNATTIFFGDDVWGTSDLMTLFRNQEIGWETSYTQNTIPTKALYGVRAVNWIGNVLGEPGYHTQYQAYAVSTSAGDYTSSDGGTPQSGVGTYSKSIFSLGFSDSGGLGNCTSPPACDPVVYSTAMRWGNYDTVDAAAEWNSTEGSPGSVAYVNANSPTTETLPTSFYLTSRPAWFRSVAFPPYGPDVTGGTTGICTSGTYSGYWVTSSAQCAGGTYTASSWGGHANANPAQDCYLNVMNGPPDGTGGVLSFDANTCYYNDAAPAPATNVVATPH
jgi:hypothetical protein